MLTGLQLLHAAHDDHLRDLGLEEGLVVPQEEGDVLDKYKIIKTSLEAFS